MNGIRFALLLGLTVVSQIFACADRQSDRDQLIVFAGIDPVAGIAESIGGDRIELHTLLKPGETPHTFSPSPRQLTSLSQADLYLQAGLSFENRIMDKFAMGQKVRLVDLSAGVAMRHFTASEEGEHGRDHGHGKADPHIWTSPHNLKIMAQNITQALIDSDPSDSAYYRNNYSDYIERADSVDELIGKSLKLYAGSKIYVFHPAFGYFADRYNLQQVAVEMAGKKPTPGRLREIIEQAKTDTVRMIFVQPQFDQKSARTISEAVDAEVIAVDPLSRDMLVVLAKIANMIVTDSGATNGE